jgi:hypothetical protein
VGRTSPKTLRMAVVLPAGDLAVSLRQLIKSQHEASLRISMPVAGAAV